MLEPLHKLTTEEMDNSTHRGQEEHGGHEDHTLRTGRFHGNSGIDQRGEGWGALLKLDL